MVASSAGDEVAVFTSRHTNNRGFAAFSENQSKSFYLNAPENVCTDKLRLKINISKKDNISEHPSHYS
jgi:hypothetical protein